MSRYYDRDLTQAGVQDQRKREVLRAFSIAAPGTPMPRVLKQCRITYKTFTAWKNDPAFREEYEQIKRERQTVDMAPFEKFIGAIDRALIDRALTGDVPAIRTVYERMGLISRAGTNVQVNQSVGVQAQASVQAQAALGDVGAILERANNLQELLDRQRARIAAAPSGPEPAGPATDGAGAAERAGEPPAAGAGD